VIAGLSRPEPPARLAFLFATMAFLADWASKGWAEARLTTMPVEVGDITLFLVENDALVFSLGAGALPSDGLVLARLALFAVCAWLAVGSVRLRTRQRVGFGLLAAGALGNLVDLPFRDGAVIDFIGVDLVALMTGREAFHLFFNLADVYIFAGLALVLPVLRQVGLAAQARFREWEGRLLGV
jgi:signal peptidase II